MCREDPEGASGAQWTLRTRAHRATMWRLEPTRFEVVQALEDLIGEVHGGLTAQRVDGCHLAEQFSLAK